MSALQTDIERRLAQSEPDVEVLLAEVVGGRCLRVYIDHPDGVTLGVCERVTALLSEERERYSLEVSSPGAERPLSKPAHFRRFVGRRARVRTRHPRPVGHPADQRSADARPTSSFTGSWWEPPRMRSLWPPMGASSRSPTRRSAVRTSSKIKEPARPMSREILEA